MRYQQNNNTKKIGVTPVMLQPKHLLTNKAKRTYVIMLIDVLIGRWQNRIKFHPSGRCAFTELKKSPFAVSM